MHTYMITTIQLLRKQSQWIVLISALVFGLLFTLPTDAKNIGDSCSATDPCGGTLSCVENKCAQTFGVEEVASGLSGTLGNESLIKTATRIINVALGLLGVIAVVIILIGGFKWMTAGGNEDKVAEARKMIFAGIIGLAIILSAWAIAKFVIQSLSQATGSGSVQ